jgi:hypothetical protein
VESAPSDRNWPIGTVVTVWAARSNDAGPARIYWDARGGTSLQCCQCWRGALRRKLNCCWKIRGSISSADLCGFDACHGGSWMLVCVALCSVPGRYGRNVLGACALRQAAHSESPCEVASVMRNPTDHAAIADATGGRSFNPPCSTVPAVAAARKGAQLEIRRLCSVSEEEY